MTDAREAPITVLYVAGVSRCGSTILGKLLGQIDGFFFAGELAHMARSLELDHSCGCGEPLRTCSCWRRIFDADPELAPAELRLDHADERARAVLRHALCRRGLLRPLPRVQRATTAFAAALSAIRESSGCRVIVDTSKSPAYGLLLEGIPGIDLRLLHLVREPRATAWSWQRTPLLNARPWAVAVIWTAWNTVIELLWARRHHYLRIRYEDFVANPQASVQRILELVDEGRAQTPFVGEREAIVEPTHDVEGNPGPNRLNGRIEIRRGDSWPEKVAPATRRLVSALTLPGRRRYGYLGHGD